LKSAATRAGRKRKEKNTLRNHEDSRIGATKDEARRAAKEKRALKATNGNFGKKMPGLGDLLQGTLPPANTERPEISEEEILKKVHKILESIEV